MTGALLSAVRLAEQETPDGNHVDNGAFTPYPFVFVAGHDGGGSQVEFGHGFAKGRQFTVPGLRIPDRFAVAKW